MAKLLLGSVVGPQGPQGTPGVNGSQGPQGVPGPNEIAATTDVVGLTTGQLLYNNGGKVGSVEIVDNLTSTATDKPLSANKGRVLGEDIHEIDTTRGYVYINTVTDLNNATESGRYRINNGLNQPVSGAFIWAVDVVNGDAGLIQRATCVSGDAAVLSKTYERIWSYAAGGWKAWKEIPDKSYVDSAIGQNTSDLNAHKADYASLFLTNANAKNSIYRGKYLGSSVTTEQYQAISSGTFTDLYIGDYWTIGGINWRIAAFNYYRNTGDSLVPGNHITLVPDTVLYNHVMNSTNITTGGYVGSEMYTVGLEQAKTTIRGIFGAHLVKHRLLLCNATVDGKSNGWAWSDSEVELMNEIMVYGSSVWGDSSLGGGSGYNVGVSKSQLPLFRLNPRMINTSQTYWLRDVVSSAYFAYVSSSGRADSNYASRAFGVRPAFSIS